MTIEAIRAAINEKTKLVTIQRSKGYATRPTFSVEQIGELIAFVQEASSPDVICMVDNCYGEFVETIEPSDVGADMVVGSLIKNPGGGLAPIGGYICGTKACVEPLRLPALGPGPRPGGRRQPWVCCRLSTRGCFPGADSRRRRAQGRDLCRQYL